MHAHSQQVPALRKRVAVVPVDVELVQDQDLGQDFDGARAATVPAHRAPLTRTPQKKKRAFFGCYLLTPAGPPVTKKSKVYIGFTVDPNRRLRQHNGEIKGGAHTTRRYRDRFGDWDMRLCVYGFPTKVAALRFEWAWQNPHKSKRLRQIPPSVATNHQMAAKLAVLSEMLVAPSWKRLPLTLQWIDRHIHDMFDREKRTEPPTHMAISYGAINKNMLYCVDPECKCEETQWGTHDSDDLLRDIGRLDGNSSQDIAGASARARAVVRGGSASTHAAPALTCKLKCDLCKHEMEAGSRMTCRKPPCPSLPVLSQPVHRRTFHTFTCTYAH